MIQVLPPNKTVIGFFIRVAACYAVLIGIWPLIGNTYADVYRWSANKVFHWFGPDGQAVFEAAKPKTPEAKQPRVRDQTRVKIRNLKSGYARWAQSGSTRYTGYVPAAVTLSLIVSTPLPWKRRVLSAIWGVLLVHVSLIIRWCILLTYEFSKEDRVQLIAPGPWGKSFLLFLVDPICASVLFLGFVVPAVIWVAVTFRKSDAAWLKSLPLK